MGDEKTFGLFGLGHEKEPTLGEVLGLDNQNMRPEIIAITRVLKNPELVKDLQRKKRGRPKKENDKDFDTLRATIIFEAAKGSTNGHHTIRKWIEIAKEVGQRKGDGMELLFPKLQNLEYSVSRGLKKIGAPKGWNRKLAK